jgi:hypothetical protein
MAPKSARDSQRGRRIVAAVISIAALLAAVSTLMTGTVPARADSPGPGNAPPLKKSPAPIPTLTPLCGTEVNPDRCPSVSPSEVVVSPVAPDPIQSAATPAYLIGTAPSPTPVQDGTNTVSSPVPLGGGFIDPLPTPSPQATTAPASDLLPHQAGLPLPFLAVGTLLILGAAGSLLYAVAPRQKKVFVRDRPQGDSPALFTPYSPNAPSSNILSSAQPPRPGPQTPA